MADQLISPLVGKLFDYVTVPVGRQFSYLFDYNGNLDEYRNQLRELKTAGRDVELLVEAAERNGEVILPSVEDWLKRVNEESDESQRFVGEEDAISKCCFNGPVNLKVRYQRSRKATKKAAEFDRIKNNRALGPVSLPAPPLPIGSMKNDHEFNFESRMSVFNEIMDAIKDDGVEMIGIWGMPGIGKTTLVKKIAKFARDEGFFEVVAMAAVSQKPSVKAIQGKIAEMIGLKFTIESEEGQAGQLLQRILARKKILIILDDIWDSLVLNDIGIPSVNQHRGCKIILTSRIRDVCEEMGTEKNFKIDLLSENEALNLFLHMSGVDDRSSEKGQLAEKLSKECARLPISIVIVARGLLNRRLLHWTDMLNRLCKSDPNRKLREIIELSYHNLDREEEKLFFLLCALFPEDYDIPVQVLFEYGIGLDLFKRVDDIDEALVRANKLALSLKSSSLLLDEGTEKLVKMHDVVRDVALAITSEGKHVFLVRSVARSRDWTEKTAISLWSNDIKKFPDALDCPRLQILMLNCSNLDFERHNNFFSGMKNLLVLDMSGLEFCRLPESFAGLENLQTLRLSECKLGDISTIGKLQNLVSLSFSDSNIEVLPKEVGELTNLRLLDLSSCERLKAITPGVIQKLSQLELLYMGRNVQWCNTADDSSSGNASLSELINLSSLTILEICIPDALMLPDELLFENLTKFKISVGGDDDLERKKIFCSSSPILVLKCLPENVLRKAGIKTLMKKAQHLELEDISGISIALPSHLGGNESLKELIVSHCKDVNYVFDMNESEYEPETPSLQLLHLIDLPLLEEISIGEFPSSLVNKLEHLRLHELPNLVCLWQFPAQSVALTNLTTVKVEHCDKLQYFSDRGTAKSLLKLKELAVNICRNLQALYLSKEDEQDDDIVFPLLSQLKLSVLNDFTSFDSKFDWESTLFSKRVILLALETLDIYDLDKLKKIWHYLTPVESFFQLKVLRLIQCAELLVVFPPQATWNLRNLEEICIADCFSVEVLFQSDDVPSNVGNEMILFPRLVKLKLVNLPKLTALLRTTSKNISQAKVNFPILKTIHLEGLKSMTKIWHEKVSAECFGQLQQLYVSECSQLVEVFSSRLVPNLHSLEKVTVEKCFKLENLFQLDFCPVSETKTMTILKQLKFLKLGVLPSLKQNFWTDEEHFSGVKVIFPTIESMTLTSLHHLESIVLQRLLTSFPKLKKLHLESIGRQSSNTDQLHIILGFEALEELTIKDCYIGGKEGLRVIATLPRLRKLQLRSNREPIEWSESLYQCKGFQNLTSLNFSYCDALKSLLTSSIISCLVHLEELFVTQCNTMESIVGETNVEPNFDKVIEFSKLQILVLDSLPQLTSFYTGECALKFPCLGDILIENCRHLKTFASMAREMPEPSIKNSVPAPFFDQQVSFGRLKHLKFQNLRLVEETLHSDQSLSELSVFKIDFCYRLSTIFPSERISGLQNLTVLHVESCDSLERVFAEKNHHPPLLLSNLQELQLCYLPKLKQLWWNENTCESFGLPSLRSLTINKCPALNFVFDPSAASRMENLRSLFVEDCSSMVEIVAETPGKKIVFPLLHTLHLTKLPVFIGFPAELQSVEFPLVEHVIAQACLERVGLFLLNVKHLRNKN